MINLNTSIKQLNRVGATAAQRLGRLGIFTVEDLLYWFPFRYEDYSKILQINKLEQEITATVRCRVEMIANKRIFKNRKIITEALVSDNSGSIRVVWFNQPFIIKNITVGDIIFLSGNIKRDMIGLQFSSPIYEKEAKKEIFNIARIAPIYPTTNGLTQKQIRFLVSQLSDVISDILDWLPDEILDKFDLTPLNNSIQGIHFPIDENELKQSTIRLKFNELFLIQMKSELVRRNNNLEKAQEILFKEKEIKSFVSSLSFCLTKAQKIATWDILQDLQMSKPMNRLLSGDVGSGKTVVAAIGLYNTVLNGYQAIMMAPTEILAMQHYKTLCKLFDNKIKIALLTRSQFLFLDKNNLNKKITKKKLLCKIENNEVDIIIGTHALIAGKIKFGDIGFVVVDEQHRFGVKQRKAIKDKTKNKAVHFLSMTATPIPRSLALMIYGDLSLSTINEMPKGRKSITTRLVDQKDRNKAYEFIRIQVEEGRQVFVICSLIDNTSKEEDLKSIADDDIFMQRILTSSNDKKSVMDEYDKLSKIIFPNLRVDYLHGKLKPKEKEEKMKKFENGEIDILVSTSVVEVGVDIPNASVMMIEGAEMFGLAQLHQFRGRVGRSSHQSYCFLFTDNCSMKAKNRLLYFEKNLDGFKLSQKDLETRGPGEVYGTTQSGLEKLRLAKLTDVDIIKKARDAADFACDNLNKYPILKKKMDVFLQDVHLE